MGVRDVDSWRQVHLAVAEFIDAWRVIPRLLVAGYAYFLYKVIDWYMTLEPHIAPGCDVTQFAEQCIVPAPTTQHAVLVTAVVGIAGAVFGFYTNTGRKWGEGIKFWKSPKE